MYAGKGDCGDCIFTSDSFSTALLFARSPHPDHHRVWLRHVGSCWRKLNAPAPWCLHPTVCVQMKRIAANDAELLLDRSPWVRWLWGLDSMQFLRPESQKCKQFVAVSAFKCSFCARDLDAFLIDYFPTLTFFLSNYYVCSSKIILDNKKPFWKTRETATSNSVFSVLAADPSVCSANRIVIQRSNSLRSSHMP